MLSPKQASSAELFCDVRQLTERLAERLTAEDQTVQSMPDVSPTKWHRAHVTWFFETFLLQPHEHDFKPFDDGFNFLFNSYYEAVGERHPRPERGLITRPGAAEVSDYRRHVDERVLTLLGSASGEHKSELEAIIELGRHHEQQHQELLLMDIKHVLSNSSLEPVYLEADHEALADPGPLGWVDFDGGIAAVGRSSDHPDFGFDNEGPRHDVLVQPFRLADRLVTAGEWIEFMEDGGYSRPELWLSDGWYTRLAEGWEAPLYWKRKDADWHVHTLHGTRLVDANEPVCHVSFYEADAYATWTGNRLATEFEWELAVDGEPNSGHLLNDDGYTAPRLHPAGAGEPTGGLRQTYGSCWEWTESAYRPYPGYRPPPGPIGEYNGKFMINTMVLRGGSAFTPQGHIRSTYRNFFHPHTRWHLSGVRLASSSGDNR